MGTVNQSGTARSQSSYVMPLVITMCSAGLLAAGVFYFVSRLSVETGSKPVGLMTLLLCYLGALGISSAGLALYNKARWNQYFPKYRDGKTNIYAQSTRVHAALTGIGLWGLPLALPMAIFNTITQQPDSPITIFLLNLMIWISGGVFFGLIMRGVSVGAPPQDPQQ